MMTHENDDLIARVDGGARRARQRTLIWTLLPVALALVFLGYSSSRLVRQQRAYNEIAFKLDSAKAELTLAEEREQALQARMDSAFTLLEYSVSLGPYAYKQLATSHRVAELAHWIFAAKAEKWPWKLGGSSPEEGYDSPGFARAMLYEAGLKPLHELRLVDEPENGDVVVYETGYTMFFFRNFDLGPDFVVGMTPFGIMALRDDFANVKSIHRIELAR